MKNSGNTLHFKQGKLFLWHIQLLGYILVISSIYAIFTNLILAAFLVPIGLFLMVSNKGLIIDFDKSEYFDYTTYLFYKAGERKKFNEIDKIYINKLKMKQQLNSPRGTQGYENSYFIYHAYVKFNNGDKVLINSSSNKEKLITSLKDLLLISNQSLVDNSLN